DGDPDVVLGEHVGDTRLLIFENNGDATSWTQHVIDPGGRGIDHHDGAVAFDFDGDGDFDILSLGWHNQKLWLYENKAVNLSDIEDDQPPSVPQNVRAVAVSSEAVEVTWGRSVDNISAPRYEVYRDEVLVGRTAATSWIDSGLEELTAYSYTIRAVDRSGNQSAASRPAVASTRERDRIAPTAPGAFSAIEQGPFWIHLAWKPASDNVAISGYRIFDAGELIGEVPGTSTSYLVSGLSPNEEHEFAIEAVDADRNASVRVGLVVSTAGLNPDRPIAAWGFEEATDSVTAYDVSGTRRHGRMDRAAQRSDEGRSGRAFDGNPFGSNVDLGGYDIVTPELTVMLWANPRSFETYDSRLISKAKGAQNEDHFLMLSTFLEQTLRFRLKTSDGETTTLVGTQSVQAGEWFHVAATYDGSEMRLYVDGIFDASTPKTGAVAIDPEVDLWIGGNPGTANRFFDGRIDDVKLFGSALDEEAIREEMSRAVPADEESPGVPSLVSASTLSSSSIGLSWIASVDNVGVAEYRVRRDGVVVGSTSATTYDDVGLSSLTRYAYTIETVDLLGNVSTASEVVSAWTSGVDEEAPLPPDGLTLVSISSDSIVLRWNEAVDNVGVTAYRVFRDGSFVGSVEVQSPAETFTFADVGPFEDVTYTYRVSALDLADNESDLSSPLEVEVSDVESPSVPRGLTATALGATRIELTWSSSTDNREVREYVIVRDGTRLPPTAELRLVDSELLPGQAYSYVVLAVDTSDNESSPSSETRVVTPPLIDSGPESVEVELGGAVTLRVQATASLPLSYQWFANATEVAGGTGSELSIASVRRVDAGEYYCVVSTSESSAQSEIAILTVGPDADFRRGDPNRSGRVDISDAAYVLGYLFTGGGNGICLDAADVDDTGRVNISDAIGILQYLFQAGAPPVAPGPDDCGIDPTVDPMPDCTNAC
ncbi:MAG: LamG-like jellyroll fold domain-containing protein, partial [Planctomycetota bacterium]